MMSFERRRHGPKLATVQWETIARSRWTIASVMVLITFMVGYWIAIGVLFPPSDDPTDTPLVPLPDFSGLTFALASERLEGAGLVAKVQARMRHPTAPPEAVLAQSPLPGQLARPGSEVGLTLSDGPPTRTIPEVEGLATAQAAELLRAMGFEVEVRREASGGRAGVRGTDPAAGTRLALPSRVVLLVSEGAPIVQVPDLRGRHVDDIESLLADADLQLGAVRYDPEAAEAPGRVISHTPTAGFDVRGGSFISVLVAGEPPDSVDVDSGDAPGSGEER
jgi:serine/threonine-protein kinase